MLKPYFDFRFEFGARKIIGLDTLKSKNDESTRWPPPAVSAGKIGDNRQMDSKFVIPTSHSNSACQKMSKNYRFTRWPTLAVLAGIVGNYRQMDS